MLGHVGAEVSPSFEHRRLQEVRDYFFVDAGWARGAGAIAGDS